MATVDEAAEDTTSAALSSHLIGVNGEPASARICYQFEGEAMYAFNMNLDMVAMTGVSPKTVVKGKAATMSVTLSRAVSNAFVRFVAADATCESGRYITIAGATEFNPAESITGAIDVVGEVADAYAACLRLADGSFHKYPQFTVRLVEVAFTPGSSDYASHTTHTPTIRTGLLFSPQRHCSLSSAGMPA